MKSKYLALLALLATASCQRHPPLNLVDRERPVEFSFGEINVDLYTLWDYELEYETHYDWNEEWFYGWDMEDDKTLGRWDIQNPHAYNIRRYFTDNKPDAPHKSVLKDFVYGNTFRGKYKVGYYDMLVWNDVETLDGVQSLHYDEESTLEYVTAYTNQSTTHTGAPPHTRVPDDPIRPGYAFYQPEFLFAGNYDDLYVSDKAEDYDYYDEATNTWHKTVPINLTPVTYIYLTQVVLHNNRGRISGIDGSANLTGVARSVNLKSHVNSMQDISVNYPVRMKQHLSFISKTGQTDYDVDIVGGRVFTFGLTGTNPYRVTRTTNSYTQIQQSTVPNYMEVNMVFNNGLDSTFVFNITKQMKERYKGGVITVELDLDTVPIPTRAGGSGFDAAVEDFEQETHEFDM